MPFIFTVLQSRRARRWLLGVALVTIVTGAAGAVTLHRLAGERASISPARLGAELAAARARDAAVPCGAGLRPDARGASLFQALRGARQDLAAARALDARHALRADVATIRRGLDLARCDGGLLAIMIGAAIVDDAAASARIVATELPAGERAAAASEVAAALEPPLRVDEIITRESDRALLGVRSAAEADQVLALRDRVRARCPGGPAGTGVAACADALEGDRATRTYVVGLRKYVETRAMLVRLQGELTRD